MKPILRLESVGYNKSQKQILKDISFNVFPGDILKIIGPNGGGKTTLAKLITGVKRPTSGRMFRDSSVKLAYMPQKMHLNNHLPLKVSNFLNLVHKVSRNVIHDYCSEFKLNQLLDKQLSDLSGGELQRVLFVNVLLADADLLILDEPAMGLDVLGQDKLYWYLTKLNKEHKKTIIVVSHDLHTVMKSTNKVLCINKHICCQGSPSEVASDQKYLNIFGDSNFLSTYKHHHNHEH